jgi:hypothetical protein
MNPSSTQPSKSYGDRAKCHVVGCGVAVMQVVPNRATWRGYDEMI